MEDLKIILYIVIAIGWVIYNNYKKITREAAKRDPQRPAPESKGEYWPPFPAGGPENLPGPEPVIVPKPTPRRFTHKLKKEPAASAFLDTSLPVSEGGLVQPSRSVQFAPLPEIGNEEEHPWLQEFRSGTDWRKMVVGYEILQRPYQ